MTSYTLPDPRGLTWSQWANTAAGFNPAFGQYVHPSMPWAEYGRALQYLIPATPRPDLFATWQEWARALKLSVG